MDLEKKILLIDFCNFEDYPIGGYLTFAKSLINAFNKDVALVGITTKKEEPVGTWFKKSINGSTLDYFAIARYNKFSVTKHFLPDRLVIYILLKYYKRKILKNLIPNIFVQRPEVLIAIHNFGSKNICFRFAGLENPLSISKYKYASFIAKAFEKHFFKKLRHIKPILAAGDTQAIKEMVERSEGIVPYESIIQFPTRINIDIFKPIDKISARNHLKLVTSSVIITTTGRLARLKGWKFMIDSFHLFLKKIPDSLFYIIGEGEDYNQIDEYCNLLDLKSNIILTGKKNSEQISLFLNASDLFIMGSYKEGWSTSLSEAVACGIPACVTNFSSAKDIIQQGKNGYVVSTHDSTKFADQMLESLKIPLPINNEKIKTFASSKLKEEIIKIWHLE